jgi:hypothetical protein
VDFPFLSFPYVASVTCGNLRVFVIFQLLRSSSAGIDCVPDWAALPLPLPYLHLHLHLQSFPTTLPTLSYLGILSCEAQLLIRFIPLLIIQTLSVSVYSNSAHHWLGTASSLFFALLGGRFFTLFATTLRARLTSTNRRYTTLHRSISSP